MSPLPVGKLSGDTLQRLFAKYVRGGGPADERESSRRVVVGPRVGEDAAVLDMGDRYLVVTTDPITFATDAAGWYALHVNANDVAVRGARPAWFLATCLLPEGETEMGRVEELFAEIAEACDSLGVALVGGHTEVTAGLSRPIVVGAMLGEVAKDRLVTTGGARPGDALLVTKGVPLEGAALIARERGDEAARRGVPAGVIASARALLRRPGISVVPEARVATETARVHAMHDPTEGGLATACWELAEAAEAGVRVERERVPLLPEGARLCEAFGLDPLGTIASGSLLLAVAPADAAGVAAACQSAGIACAAIGAVTERRDGMVLVEGGRPRPLPVFLQDEISKLFAGS
jgi:hydrogenase expression/formation protein HypE